MTDRKYTQAEFYEELLQAGEGDQAAENRIMGWFSEVQYNLGHVGSLYENLKRVTSEKVAAEVRAEVAEQRIWHLERQLAGLLPSVRWWQVRPLTKR